MTTRRFHQVDVFAAEATQGNPLAVVHDADGLDDTQMAAFARWTNLSETTFLLPPTEPGADYRVRIFTPGGELPFAGHPTLGSAWAWRAAGGTPREAGFVVQQCGIGLVRLRQAGGRLAFAAPPLLRSGPADAPTLAQAVHALGVAPEDVVGHQWVVNGPEWLAIRLRTRAQVLALKPDMAAMGRLKLGVVAVDDDGETAAEVRAFVPGIGVAEDPVTGSLNAGLALWLIGSGVLPGRYVAAQGTALGRAGRVHVESDGDTVWIGGEVTPCIEGRVTL
ncbi:MULTISPECIES: PhzF family phenazine biosynthesis protein [Rubrivivax]|uniref:PhzF family phenazine biosynthesis protein n=1 Tax=Rubrivivax benzoatilyticus TaxID=316997 RepID=A0ABX0HWD4_9BURK|nr:MULTISPECIES: PhzF family phenazine biosynthesis protein [Rubrivivax]EGJ10859.1 phenazine biosynthesis protein PhzF family [Rubrivivax benzoatilyticus JA2 = ATCC BAA-35]NHK98913.1 PhzF family phenazine biosynthesis protein [Rubrivivax benzoatilyticus]NHL24415.1 PhzF family phenazine biosynthesis protein [Rubrivivax benzoatilyticus]